MTTVSLDIDRLKANENARVLLTYTPNYRSNPVTGEGGGTNELARTWEAYLAEDFTFTSSVDYNSPFESLLDNISTVLAGLGTAMNQTFGFDFEQLQLKSLRNTSNVWTGTTRPNFDLDLVFVRTSLETGVNPLERVQNLFAMQFPQAQDGDDFLRAPGGYSAIKANEFGSSQYVANGVWTLRIGTWLLIPGLNLMGVSPAISSITTEDGQPLYATCSVSLSPYRLVSEAEVRRWFKVRR